MNVIRINTKNVIYIILAILSTSVREAHMGYGEEGILGNKFLRESCVHHAIFSENLNFFDFSSTLHFSDTISNYASNNNSTPAQATKKEDLSSICPAGSFCSELSAECLSCTLNLKCNYGVSYQANCTVLKQIDCVGETNFVKSYICRYCYQTDHWEHDCHQKNSCSSVSSPQQYYRTNCTVKSDILCLGRRKFLKNLPCNWTGGYRWSTALILSITLGGFGADRFYLGHWQEGIGKLFSFGGLGVWTLIDVMLISMRYLGPADGSLYV